MKSFILSLFFSICLFLARAEKFDILIKNANIVDIKNDSIINNCDIGITDQQIQLIVSSYQSHQHESLVIINAKGKFIIPGLWDMHVHLYYPEKEYLQMYLAYGVVGVREMSGKKLHWKDSTGNDPNVPRIIFGSKGCDGPVPWFKSKEPVKTAAEARGMVQKAKKEGFDFIKLFSLVPRDQYMAIVDECGKLDMEFSGHIPHCMHILEAAKLGQKSNEHLEGMLRACSNKEKQIQKRIDSLLIDLAKRTKMNGLMQMQISGCSTKASWSFSQAKADSVITELCKYNMFQCPTLSVSHDFADDRLDCIYTDDRYRYAPPFLNRVYRPTKRDLYRTGGFRNKLKLLEKLLLQMHKKGIKILAGTDQGCAGYNLHDELEYLTNVGFSNAEALKTASINPAIYMNKENLAGTIAIGKLADIVILNSNPLEQISNTRDVYKVIFKGKVLNPKDLKEAVKKKNDEFTKKYEERDWW
jgi:imidazolonepropionase-like amidohydrolase